MCPLASAIKQQSEGGGQGCGVAKRARQGTQVASCKCGMAGRVGGPHPDGRRMRLWDKWGQGDNCSYRSSKIKTKCSSQKWSNSTLKGVGGTQE
jgi:hypothetical protein